MLACIILVRIYCAGNFVFLKKRLTLSSLKDVLLRTSVLPTSHSRLVFQCDILCSWKLQLWFLNYPLWCLVIFFVQTNVKWKAIYDYCIKVMAFTIDRFIILFAKVANGNNNIEWRTVTLLNGNWSYSHILG